MWNQHALDDRDGNMEYVGNDSPAAAIEMDDEIERQVDALIIYPKIGRSGRILGTRELVISRTPYIAVYQLDEQERCVEILRILTNWQQWP
ncbi:type II toxin-antitoxin system RelE/ParE family toxin [Paraburkholderia silviterrae]|uniref:type II toxin-antitoxin system RelE/ParE family toxin n=1 Tax=Paraburkholderia silviterrae TaxID=2528715 RepID=UPI001F0EC611|nr:type II toxin-antitoxin system RelE/ParE family toxin [Paraburkholderia silviterrae]